MNAPETVYLALGTNLGDRMVNLEQAVARLAGQMLVVKSSAIYETAPWGFTDQPSFLNMVLEVQTTLAPLTLLALLKQIESDLGRLPSFRYGPRHIDIDILFYGERVIAVPGLSIPHPRLAERQFVLVPLAEIAPDLSHPQTGRTVREMLAVLDEPLSVFVVQER